ncbi:MAG: hypothetical protein ACSLEY_03490 [Candidatus Saccharimonadales bacterium]
MSKQKKKRNKVYTGVGAKVTQSTVVRVEAVKRNKTSQWWHDRKKFVRPVATIVGVIALVIILLSGLLQLLVS